MKLRLLLVLFASLASTALQGQEDFCKLVEYGYDSERYYQDHLQKVDPVGDAHLFRQLDTIPIKLLSFSHFLPQATLEKKKKESEGEPFVIRKSMPIDIDRYLNKCAEIMRANFPEIFPTISEEHRWSPEAQKYLPGAFWHRLGCHISGKQRDFPAPLLMRTKLFLCLACGWTARYCVTGQEQALLERLMTYPDKGVQLHDIFAESYLLNRGDIYLTFLTCENLLANCPFRMQRERDKIQPKLSYIRHDSKEIGDNYGAWYHFFGIALYGLLRTEFVSVFVADTESFGSFFLEGPDRQEDLINHYGAIFGRKFRDMMEDGSWWLKTGDAYRTDYLLPNEG